MPRNKTATTVQDAPPEPTFEEALGSLESIIEAMEHENLPLADLVSHYEKGSGLLNRCESILQAARGRIELITLRNQAEIGLEAAPEAADVPAPSPVTAAADDPDDDDSNDIRLF